MQAPLHDLEPYARGVRKVGATYEAQTFTGDWAAIRKGESNTDIFNPGWEPVFVYAGFAPLYVLELEHSSQGSASWFLDAGMHLIGIAFASLPREHQVCALGWGARLARNLLETIVLGRAQLLDAEAKAFLRVNSATRIEIFAVLSGLGPKLLRTGKLISLEAEEARSHNAEINGLGRVVSVQYAHLEHALRNTYPSTVRTAVQRGELLWPSPVDGASVPCDGSFMLPESVILYRFFDNTHDLPFFAIASAKTQHYLAVWFPVTGNCIATDQRSMANLPVWQTGVPLQGALLQIIGTYGQSILDYAIGTAKRIGLCCELRRLHDLAGLYDVVQCAAPEVTPELIVSGQQETQCYGPLETLLPSLLDKTTRVPDAEASNHHAFTHGLVVLTTTPVPIQRLLADRIIAEAEAGAECHFDRLMFRTARALNYPILLLGIGPDWPGSRLDDFCAQIVAHLVARCKGLAVVIDRNNAALWDGSQCGFSQGLAGDSELSPAPGVRSVVQSLHQRFGNLDELLIYTAGAQVRHSIYWSSHCHFFVTLPGEHLVLYRWIANKPGMVVTLPGTADADADLDRYNSMAKMEVPAAPFIVYTEPVGGPREGNPTKLPSDECAAQHHDPRQCLDASALGARLNALLSATYGKAHASMSILS
jgi:hypothetical protein